VDQMFGQQVPEPETLILFGSGLCVFAWLLRRRAGRPV
jgi:hypothetical protein